MASWRKMLMMSTTWLIFMAIFSIFAIIDGVFWSAWDNVILNIPIPAPVVSYVGNAFWIQPFSYVFILVLAIVMTYKIVQATADETDYGQELYYDSWGP
jgi:membrane protein implicated in regulation of membrane protease activity